MYGGLKYVSRAALLAAAVSMGGVAAQAADLGGDCCADLEERVAELEATTARKGNRVMSLQVYGQVNRGMVWHDDDSDENKLGDVNEFSFRDMDGRSGTRFGFRGSASVTSDVSIGFRLELAVDDDTSTSFGSTRHSVVYVDSGTLGRISFGRTSTATDGLAEIALAGAITPFSAEEGASVSPIADSSVPGFDGARRQGVHYTSPTIAGFIFSASYFHGVNADIDGDNDADGWDVALRYAGEFGAFRVAAGVGYRVEQNGEPEDAPGELLDTDGVKDGTGADSNMPGDGADTETFILAGSLMHTPTGLFVNAGYGQQDDPYKRTSLGSFVSQLDVDDADTFNAPVYDGISSSGSTQQDVEGWNVQVGISQNWFGFGATTLAGNYGMTEFSGVALGDSVVRTSPDSRDGNVNEKSILDEARYFGFGITQNIDAAATDLYLTWQRYEVDGFEDSNSATNVIDRTKTSDEADVIQAGMRVRF